MAPQKLYHLVPTLNVPPPPHSPIALGQLFAKPHDLESHLQKASTFARPDDADIFTQEWGDFTRTISNAKSGKAGLWAKFLDFKGLGGGLGGSFDSSREGDYDFETLTTEYFDADDEYINAAINDGAVDLFLENKKVVYMLKSLMIAKGTKFNRKNTRGREGHANIGSSANGPVAAGGEMEGGGRHTSAMTFGASSGFIFAYSMLKITCRWDKETAEHVVKKKSPVGGGFMGKQNGTDGQRGPRFEFESVEEESLEDEQEHVVQLDGDSPL